MKSEKNNLITRTFNIHTQSYSCKRAKKKPTYLKIHSFLTVKNSITQLFFQQKKNETAECR